MWVSSTGLSCEHNDKDNKDKGKCRHLMLQIIITIIILIKYDDRNDKSNDNAWNATILT